MLVAKLANRTDRHRLAILELGELLDDPIELRNFSGQALDVQILHSNALVGLRQHLLELVILGLALDKLVMIGFARLLDSLQTLLKALDFFTKVV